MCTRGQHMFLRSKYIFHHVSMKLSIFNELHILNSYCMSTQAYCVTIICEYTKINTLGYLIYFCRIFCFTVFKLLQVQMYLNYYNNNYYKKTCIPGSTLNLLHSVWFGLLLPCYIKFGPNVENWVIEIIFPKSTTSIFSVQKAFMELVILLESDIKRWGIHDF